MNGDDGTRPGGQVAFHFPYVDIAVVSAHVDQDWSSAQVAHDLGRRREGRRGNDDFIFWADSYRLQGEVQCGGAGVDCDGVFALHSARKLRFEPFCLRASCDPPRAENVDDRSYLSL